MNGVRKLTLRG